MKPTLFWLTNTPEELLAGSVREPSVPEVLAPLSKKSEVIPTHRVLIAHLDQLHDFVQHVPPLAWELLEYASEPLEIVYPERKPKLIRADQPSSICVRWVRQPQLLRLVQKEGPLWAVYPLATNAADSPPWKKIDCFSKKYPYQRVRTVELFADDTFRFLR